MLEEKSSEHSLDHQAPAQSPRSPQQGSASSPISVNSSRSGSHLSKRKKSSIAFSSGSLSAGSEDYQVETRVKFNAHSLDQLLDNDTASNTEVLRKLVPELAKDKTSKRAYYIAYFFAILNAVASASGFFFGINAVLQTLPWFTGNYTLSMVITAFLLFQAYIIGRQNFRKYFHTSVEIVHNLIFKLMLRMKPSEVLAAHQKKFRAESIPERLSAEQRFKNFRVGLLMFLGAFGKSLLGGFGFSSVLLAIGKITGFHMPLALMIGCGLIVFICGFTATFSLDGQKVKRNSFVKNRAKAAFEGAHRKLYDFSEHLSAGSSKFKARLATKIQEFDKRLDSDNPIQLFNLSLYKKAMIFGVEFITSYKAYLIGLYHRVLANFETNIEILEILNGEKVTERTEAELAEYLECDVEQASKVKAYIDSRDPNKHYIDDKVVAPNAVFDAKKVAAAKLKLAQERDAESATKAAKQAAEKDADKQDEPQKTSRKAKILIGLMIALTIGNSIGNFASQFFGMKSALPTLLPFLPMSTVILITLTFSLIIFNQSYQTYKRGIAKVVGGKVRDKHNIANKIKNRNKGSTKRRNLFVNFIIYDAAIVKAIKQGFSTFGTVTAILGGLFAAKLIPAGSMVIAICVSAAILVCALVATIGLNGAKVRQAEEQDSIVKKSCEMAFQNFREYDNYTHAISEVVRANYGLIQKLHAANQAEASGPDSIMGINQEFIESSRQCVIDNLGQVHTLLTDLEDNIENANKCYERFAKIERLHAHKGQIETIYANKAAAIKEQWQSKSVDVIFETIQQELDNNFDESEQPESDSLPESIKQQIALLEELMLSQHQRQSKQIAAVELFHNFKSAVEWLWAFKCRPNFEHAAGGKRRLFESEVVGPDSPFAAAAAVRSAHGSASSSSSADEADIEGEADDADTAFLDRYWRDPSTPSFLIRAKAMRQHSLDDAKVENLSRTQLEAQRQPLTKRMDAACGKLSRPVAVCA